MVSTIHIFYNLNMDDRDYLARVENVKFSQKGIEVAFVCYNSASGSVNFDEIRPTSRHYEQAKKLKVGDEVYVEANKIFRFKRCTPFERLCVRTIKAWWFNFKNLF